MVRPILRFGADVLHGPARPVEAFTPELHALIDDMIETMRAAPGIGLAAPQVGVPLRLFVIDIHAGRNGHEPLVFVNPTFVQRTGMQLEEEGCLSLPGFNATVVRPLRAVVRAQGRDGEWHELDGSGLLARALQHEMDHLEGRLFVERLRSVRRHVILRNVQRLQRTGKW